jgi:hypothetical protein
MLQLIMYDDNRYEVEEKYTQFVQLVSRCAAVQTRKPCVYHDYVHAKRCIIQHACRTGSVKATEVHRMMLSSWYTCVLNIPGRPACDAG